MAIKETKVTDEELKELENFQQNINVITYQLGQLALRKLNINEEEEVLETRYKQILLEEKEIWDKLKEKYGDASIDLKTGAITNSE